MNLQRFSLAAAAVLAALSLTACSSIDLEKDKDAASVTDATEVERMLNAKDGPLAKREIYFDFDSYSVSPQYMPIVTNHAKFLANNKNVKVMLESVSVKNVQKLWAILKKITHRTVASIFII